MIAEIYTCRAALHYNRDVQIKRNNGDKLGLRRVDYRVKVGVKGIIDFGMGLTLRDGDREYYYAALDRHFPGLKSRYIRQYGNAYELPSPNAKALQSVLNRICEANGILSAPEDCFRYIHAFPTKNVQMSMFDL